MANVKVPFAYIFGLASLIIALGIVIQGKLVEAEQLPSPTASATPLPQPPPFPGAARIARCQDVSQTGFFFYMPTLTSETGKTPTLSGTVYASDLTPLPDALVEIWPGDVSRVKNHPYPPIVFGGRLHTDEAGHYEFATTQLTASERAYLRLRITYRDYCPLLIDLHLVIEPLSKPAEHIVTKVQITGPVLQGPVNIVMPVPPAQP